MEFRTGSALGVSVSLAAVVPCFECFCPSLTIRPLCAAILANDVVVCVELLDMCAVADRVIERAVGDLVGHRFIPAFVPYTYHSGIACQYQSGIKMHMAIRNDNGEAAAAFYDKRRKWLAYVSENPRIGHASFRVGFFIAQRMNGNDQASWYSVRKIAERLSMSTHTVSAAIMELEREGLLIPVRTLGRRSSYLITGGPE